jgi:hypothetical protein
MSSSDWSAGTVGCDRKEGIVAVRTNSLICVSVDSDSPVVDIVR